MDRTLWPVVDNTAEGMTKQYKFTTSNDPERVTFGSPKIAPLVYNIGSTIGYSTASIGIIANAVVLTVLIRARRQSGSHVNTLIVNQSLMDFLACFFVLINFIFFSTGSLVYNGSRSNFADSVICVLLEAPTLASVCVAAGKVGLMVITLERYFKIVHAVAHRNFYRNWMTKVGVALPWICGVCFDMFPAIGTTRVVNGTCQRMAVWPNKAMASVSALFDLLICISCSIAL